jgi:hypothetical protein
LGVTAPLISDFSGVVLWPETGHVSTISRGGCLLDYAKKRALAELSKATGGISDTIIQTTGVKI